MPLSTGDPLDRQRFIQVGNARVMCDQISEKQVLRETPNAAVRAR